MSKSKIDFSFKIHKYCDDKIIHAQFKSAYPCCATMMRMQEFYEAPIKSLKNKYFSLEELMDEYVKHHGVFNYFQQWAAFNIPGATVIDFYRIYKKQFLDKEKILFDTLNKYVPYWYKKNFYLIATHNYKHEKSDINHELSHAFYYLDDEYHETMNNLVNQCSRKVSITKTLLKDGYSQDVIIDEIQAYLSTSSDKYLAKAFGIKNKKTAKPFKDVFKKWKKKMINGC